MPKDEIINDNDKNENQDKEKEIKEENSNNNEIMPEKDNNKIFTDDDIDKLNEREDTNNIYNYNNSDSFIMENEGMSEKKEEEFEYLGVADDSEEIDEEDEDTYSLEDDGLNTYNEKGSISVVDPKTKVKTNYKDLPKFSLGRDDYAWGDNYALRLNGELYRYDENEYFKDESHMHLADHALDRMKKNLGIDNLEKDFSLSSYKKALLKSMNSREYTSYYIDEIKIYNIFDSRNYQNLMYNLISKFDKDLNGSNQKLKLQSNNKQNNEIISDKNNIELIQNDNAYEGVHSQTLHEVRNFSSLSSAVTAFRRMEAHIFNRVIGAGEARFANKAVLNKNDYNHKILSFDIDKVKSFKSCISNDEIIRMHVKNMTDEERKDLYDGIRSNIAFMVKKDELSNVTNGALSSEKAYSILEVVNSLKALKENNKNRFFLNRWFSTASREEQEMIDAMKAGLKSYGLTDNEIEKIQNGDKEQIKTITREVQEKNEEYEKKYGVISHFDLIEKLEKNGKDALEIKNDKVVEQSLDNKKENIVQNEFQEVIGDELSENNSILIDNEQEKEENKKELNNSNELIK